jgi:hypothetical protein
MLEMSRFSFDSSIVVHPAVALVPPPRQIWKKIDDPALGVTFGGAL